RERVEVAKKLLDAADHRVAENSDTPQVIGSVSSGRRERSALWFGPRALWVGLAAAATLLVFGAFVWLARERVRLTAALEATRTQLTEQQRHEREIAGELAAARAENGTMRLELGQLQDRLAHQPAPPAPPDRFSVLSFFLSPMLTSRSGAEPQQRIEISRET